ncbi:MAG: triose-phosphate isomerase [Geminicoccaceae bacterium]
MERKFWLGTGWKMNKTRAEARAYAEALRAAPGLNELPLRLFVLPPFTALAEVAAALAGSGVMVGAQNCHWASAGAWTGEISAPQIAECGAALVELGHSERRAHFGETDVAINAKVKAVLAAGLRPLVCVGETAEERALDAATVTVARQARMALAGVAAADLDRVLLAYEPVWAIGEGRRAGLARLCADAIHGALQNAVLDLHGRAVPVLYGGSVNAANAEALAGRAAIDGLFVGRAAWTVEGLIGLARAITPIVEARPHAQIVPIAAEHRARWQELFQGYATFYKRELTDAHAGGLGLAQGPGHELEGGSLWSTAGLSASPISAACRGPLRGADISFLDDLFVDPGTARAPEASAGNFPIRRWP